VHVFLINLLLYSPIFYIFIFLSLFIFVLEQSKQSKKTVRLWLRINATDDLVRFILCTSRSLNKVGLNATKFLPEVETFFDIVKKLLNFFSRSTQKWDILTQHLKILLKGFSTNR